MTSLDRLDNCIKVLDDTIRTGDECIVSLNEQGEKIKLVQKKTDHISPQISSSRRIVSNMLAVSRYNKIGQCLIISFLIGIAVELVVLIALKK